MTTTETTMPRALTTSVREAILSIASALSALADGSEALREAADDAIRSAEQPGEEEAAHAAVTALCDLWHAVERAYVSAATQIEVVCGGAATQRGCSVPITAESLRLEGRVAAMMGAAWQREQADLWGEVADLIEV